MNPNHAELCSSDAWAAYLRDEVIPRALGDATLGEHVLELGPGYGGATRWLRTMSRRLTVVEIDLDLAERLRLRYPDIEVVCGTAEHLPFERGTFDAVASFTMLHHVPSAGQQDAILAEAVRVLSPGGWLIGSDSVASEDLERFHDGDVYNPLDPATLADRLRDAGLTSVTVVLSHEPQVLLFGGRAPGGCR